MKLSENISRCECRYKWMLRSMYLTWIHALALVVHFQELWSLLCGYSMSSLKGYCRLFAVRLIAGWVKYLNTDFILQHMRKIIKTLPFSPLPYCRESTVLRFFPPSVSSSYSGKESDSKISQQIGLASCLLQNFEVMDFETMTFYSCRSHWPLPRCPYTGPTPSCLQQVSFHVGHHVFIVCACHSGHSRLDQR